MNKMFDLVMKVRRALKTDIEVFFQCKGWWCEAGGNRRFTFGNYKNTWSVSKNSLTPHSKNTIQITAETDEADILNSLGEQTYNNCILFFTAVLTEHKSYLRRIRVELAVLDNLARILKPIGRNKTITHKTSSGDVVDIEYNYSEGHYVSSWRDHQDDEVLVNCYNSYGINFYVGEKRCSVVIEAHNVFGTIKQKQNLLENLKIQLRDQYNEFIKLFKI